MASIEKPELGEQVTEFWNQVRGRLIHHHERSPDEADLGIGRYRLDTERRRIGEAVYNQGVERTAEIVDGVIKYGLPGQLPREN
jgi:hypothetical protein